VLAALVLDFAPDYIEAPVVSVPDLKPGYTAAPVVSVPDSEPEHKAFDMCHNMAAEGAHNKAAEQALEPGHKVAEYHNKAVAVALHMFAAALHNTVAAEHSLAEQAVLELYTVAEAQHKFAVPVV
jgi:hypothetical protein